jgi:transposase
MEIVQSLLPNSPFLRLENWQIDKISAQIILNVVSTQPLAYCPLCQQVAHQIHSHYERTLADLPWGEYQVCWQLKVRKFFCNNPECKRHIFTERLANVVAPWARKTARMAQRQTSLALALGGIAGARLSEVFDYTTSRHTLLRLLVNLPLERVKTPTVLGVDDWAYRKGRNYGTIVVDLQTHQPIALLPDRESETLTKWLKAHPGVVVISRDRSRAYEKGARLGAPKAIQVADRFHLLQNLAEALEKVFNDHSQELKAVENSLSSSPVICEEGSEAVRVPLPESPSEAVVLAQQRRSRRLAIYEQVIKLREQGWSGKAIAVKLGIGKTTVFRYLGASQFPERKRRSDQGRSLIDSYKNYFLKRWNEGCHEGKQIFQELTQVGYQGSYATVARYAKRLRKAVGIKPRQKYPSCTVKIIVEDQKLPLTVHRATWLILRREENRDDEDKKIIKQLMDQHPLLAKAIQLSQDFAQLIRERTPEQFDEWLSRVLSSKLPALVAFAEGLMKDYDAVKASMIFPWSNGPVEGHINRLKMLKRQMYGRASLDLLSRRFLWAA